MHWPYCTKIASYCWLFTVVFLCFLYIYFDYNNLRVLNTFSTLIMIVVSAQSDHDIIAQCVVYNKQRLNSLNRDGLLYRKTCNGLNIVFACCKWIFVRYSILLRCSYLIRCIYIIVIIHLNPSIMLHNCIGTYRHKNITSMLCMVVVYHGWVAFHMHRRTCAASVMSTCVYFLRF